jgi:hypothetical protein
MQVKISQATRLIVSAIKAKIAPLLKGSPGGGKSETVHKIAEHFNLQLIDIRLSQCDPTDLAGFPTVTKDGKADYLPMKHFPIVGDKLPEGKAGWLLFLDEATSAPPAIQAAAYKLVLDRMVGSHHLHEKCAIVLAGNLETDGAIVHEMSTALQSRLMHLELMIDNNEWLDWAVANKVDHRITSFIKFKPGMLYTFKADHTDCTYACPRTWSFANRLLAHTEDHDLLPTLAGTISEGVAREFLAFSKIYESLLTIPQITADPTGVKVPDEPGILFALTGSIAHNITPENGDKLMPFVKRLPVEFQVVCLRETVRRNKAMLANKAIQDWVAESANNLF